MGIVKHRKIWYTFSTLLVAASLFSIFYFGLNLSIDFTGGSLLEAQYGNARPDSGAIEQSLAGANLGTISIQPVGDKNIVLRLKTLTEDQHQLLLSKLSYLL